MNNLLSYIKQHKKASLEELYQINKPKKESNTERVLRRLSSKQNPDREIKPIKNDKGHITGYIYIAPEKPKNSPVSDLKQEKVQSPQTALFELKTPNNKPKLKYYDV